MIKCQAFPEKDTIVVSFSKKHSLKRRESMTLAYLPQEYDIFVGLDVDKKSFAFTVKDRNDMKRSKKIPSDPEKFYNYLHNNHADKKVICAYEAGPTGFHLYDYLTIKDIPCLVVPPLSIPKAPNEKVKTNRIDSEKLTQHLKSGNLKSIRVPQGEYRQLRYLVKTRENYSKLYKATKQRIKALLLSAHLDSHIKDDCEQWSRNYINELTQLSCDDAVRRSLDMLLNDLQYAREQTLAIHRTLKAFCKKNETIDNYRRYLQSIPGIGFIVATTILGKIGDPRNLRNPREIGAFTGLVPTEKSTGDAIKRGSITHLGNTTLRFLLIEAAWVAIRKDIKLQQFYHRIKRRHHPKIAAKKAITAVARKLTLIVYRILKEQRMYIP
jgi:transposase